MSKVRPGDPMKIAAQDWNVLQDVAELHRRGLLTPGGANRLTSGNVGVILPFANNTGSAISRFHAFGIGNPLYTHDDNERTFFNQLTFEAEEGAAAYVGQFAIAQEIIPAGRLGAAMVAGVTVARLDVQDADHAYADIDTAGGTALITAETGNAQILWKQSGTGEKWGIIRFPASVSSTMKPLIRFQLDEDLTTSDASAAATISFQVGPGAAHSGTVTVHNPENSACDYDYSGDKGDYGWAVWDSGTDFHIIDIECP